MLLWPWRSLLGWFQVLKLTVETNDILLVSAAVCPNVRLTIHWMLLPSKAQCLYKHTAFNIAHVCNSSKILRCVLWACPMTPKKNGYRHQSVMVGQIMSVIKLYKSWDPNTPWGFLWCVLFVAPTYRTGGQMCVLVQSHPGVLRQE